MEFRNLRLYQPDGSFRTGGLVLSGDRIAATPASADACDMDGLYAIPGLIDMHVLGCAGRDFGEATEEALSVMARYQADNGICAFCPATMAAPEAQLAAMMQAAAAYRTEHCGAVLAGVYLEGPFLSESRRGSQNSAYLQKPDAALFRRLQEQAQGLIRLCALAPELPGGLDMIEQLVGEVRLSLAHTEADYDTACEAFRRGAREVTHLFNAMPPMTHREPGVIGAVLDNDEVGVELIADGVHVHPSAVRAAFRLFENRIILISDSMAAAGQGDGDYVLGGQDVTVRDGRAMLRDGSSLAGSTANLFECLQHVVQMGIPLGQAVRAASTNPARAIGIQHDYGSLEPGKLANIILLDDELHINSLILRGQLLM
nr:N-acetylglucosamine-6-phosphate deacetylase [uncultured Agathobaculum sp.]